VQVASLGQEPDAPMTTAAPSRPALRPALDVTAPAAEPPKPAPPPPAPKPAAAKPDPRAASGGKVAVQVAALGARAAAEAAAQAAARKAPAGASAHVEPATVDGRDYYRALVRGFGSRDEASRFCRTLIAGGGACFVR
jgi:septal ring-binding cell division protein DamX